MGLLAARTKSEASFVPKIMARVFFPILTLLVLFQAGLGGADSNSGTSPFSCHCRPVINVSVDGNGQCDLCDESSKLLQKVNDLKKELATIKNKISQIQPGKYWVEI